MSKIITARTLLREFPQLDKAAAKQVESLSRLGKIKKAIEVFGNATGFLGEQTTRGKRGWFTNANAGDPYRKTLTYSGIDRQWRCICVGDLLEWYEKKGIHFE